MKQTVRNNTFETNSSSTHSLAIRKIDEQCVMDYTTMCTELHYNIPFITTYPNVAYDTPMDILSYLWSISNVSHKWELLDALKKSFPNCIFQKPLYDLPTQEEPGYCEDREIISFCEVVNCDASNCLEDNAIDYILSNIEKVVFNGIIVSSYDAGFLDYVKHVNKFESNSEAKDYCSKTYEIII